LGLAETNRTRKAVSDVTKGAYADTIERGLPLKVHREGNT
jgi:hypothetical protein